MENLRRLVHKVTHRIWYWLSLNKQKETKPNDQRPYRCPTSTLSSAKAPARYPQKSNNQKIESAPIVLLALSFSILPSSLQQKKASSEERATSMPSQQHNPVIHLPSTKFLKIHWPLLWQSGWASQGYCNAMCVCTCIDNGKTGSFYYPWYM